MARAIFVRLLSDPAVAWLELRLGLVIVPGMLERQAREAEARCRAVLAAWGERQCRARLRAACRVRAICAPAAVALVEGVVEAVGGGARAGGGALPEALTGEIEALLGLEVMEGGEGGAAAGGVGAGAGESVRDCLAFALRCALEDEAVHVGKFQALMLGAQAQQQGQQPLPPQPPPQQQGAWVGPQLTSEWLAARKARLRAYEPQAAQLLLPAREPLLLLTAGGEGVGEGGACLRAGRGSAPRGAAKTAVGEMLAAGGWELRRSGGHYVWKRELAGGGGVQTFTQGRTPSAMQAWKQEVGTLARLDEAARVRWEAAGGGVMEGCR